MKLFVIIELNAYNDTRDCALHVTMVVVSFIGGLSRMVADKMLNLEKMMLLKRTMSRDLIIQIILEKFL